MGSTFEFNDTLKISKEQGFPKDLRLEDHIKDMWQSAKFLGKQYHFKKDGERIYHRMPTRVFLVEDLDGKWLYWGNAVITEQSMGYLATEGTYRITKIYDPEFQRRMTIEESPDGKSYFEEKHKSMNLNDIRKGLFLRKD